jgi:hypothetical protein
MEYSNQKRNAQDARKDSAPPSNALNKRYTFSIRQLSAIYPPAFRHPSMRALKMVIEWKEGVYRKASETE